MTGNDEAIARPTRLNPNWTHRDIKPSEALIDLGFGFVSVRFFPFREVTPSRGFLFSVHDQKPDLQLAEPIGFSNP